MNILRNFAKLKKNQIKNNKNKIIYAMSFEIFCLRNCIAIIEKLKKNNFKIKKLDSIKKNFN